MRRLGCAFVLAVTVPGLFLWNQASTVRFPDAAAVEPRPTQLHWIVTGSNMNKIQDADPGLAAYHFDAPLAYATGNEDGVHNQVPDGLAATPTLKYESYARFRSDVSQGRIDPSVTAVIYDPENWDATPLEERRDPKTFMRRFWELARGRGYQVIQTPSRDLMQVPGAVCGKRAGETLSEAFLRCGIASAAARHADIYEVQAQVHERDPQEYRWFVEETGGQARAANPSVVFLSGLSTSPYDYVATAQMLLDAHNAVADLVAGHYLSINAPEVAVAVDFLGRLRDQDLAGQDAAAGAEVQRLAGVDRVATAAEVSAATFAPDVPAAYVATAGDYPDALAGGPAAASAGGPVLLVGHDTLPEAAAGELARLRPRRIVILGGPAAVSEGVRAQLGRYAPAPVERLWGARRFGTAAAVSAAHFPSGVPVAFVATGRGFPDALAGGAAAAASNGPLLLVEQMSVPEETAAELRRLAPGRIVVLGGPQAVSDAVRQDLSAYTDGGVQRLSGSDRYATAAAAAAATFDSVATVFVATGRNFPDALAGVPAAGAAGGPVLLVAGDTVPAATSAEVERLGPDRIVILGGPAAVGVQAETALRASGSHSRG